MKKTQVFVLSLDGDEEVSCVHGVYSTFALATAAAILDEKQEAEGDENEAPLEHCDFDVHLPNQWRAEHSVDNATWVIDRLVVDA